MNKPISAADLVTPKVTTGPLVGSRKVYSSPEAAPDLRVPLREIILSDAAKEPNLPVYDTTGVYTDSDAVVDVENGLKRTRIEWVKERGGVEEYEGRPIKAVDNGNPIGLEMLMSGVSPEPLFAVERLTITFHGTTYTHMDSLSHMFHKGKTYNGYPQEQVGNTGAGTLDIRAFKGGFVGRGVLMDIPQLKGVPYLEPGTAITPADLDAWEKQAGVTVGSGDIVFFRTGRWARRAKVGPWDIGGQSAGLHPGVARWLKARDVAIVGWDGHGEVMPSVVKGVPYPMHQLLLIAMGTPIFDNCDLEAVSEAAASRKRWTFLLTASPLAIPGGTGSPLNPIATF